MDLPPHVTDLLSEFVEQARPAADVIALYVGGSLATGDYHIGVSDIELVAVVERGLTGRQRQLLARIHRGLIARHPVAIKLNCVYVPLRALPDVGARHVTWTGRILRRRFTVIARAEVSRQGLAVFGVSPAAVIPAVTDAELRDGVRRELTEYWTMALQRHWIWMRDFDVDLGLLTLARAEATLTEARLITKAEALRCLDRFRIPPDLVEQVAVRREGGHPPISAAGRLRRAMLVHRLVSDGVDTLLAL
jgi:hypothetical protein